MRHHILSVTFISAVTVLVAASGGATPPYPLTPADRATLHAACGDAMPSDDALVDCVKGKTFIGCEDIHREMTRFMTDPPQLQDRLTSAIRLANECQAAASATLPVHSYAWKPALEKLHSARAQWLSLKHDKVLKEVTPATDSGSIAASTFTPANGHDVPGMHAFCSHEQHLFDLAVASPTRAKLGAYAKQTFDDAMRRATEKLARCKASGATLVSVPDEAASEVAIMRRVLAMAERAASEHAAAIAHLADLVAHPRETVDVVAKDFIMEIGPGIGVLPGGMSLAQKIMLADHALLTDTQFSENPTTTARDGHYRFFSHKSYSFSCDGDRIVGWGWAPPHATLAPLGTASAATANGTDSGFEPARGGFKAPPAETTADTISPMHAAPNPIDPSVKGLAYVDVDWRVKAMPNTKTAPSFNAIRHRDSVYIWHRVTGRIACKAGKVETDLAISGSAFPTHRLYVTHSTVGHAVRAPEVKTVAQGPFARLWESDPTDKTLVR